MNTNPIRRWLVVTSASAAALLVAGVLDVAGADTTPESSSRTIEVKGTTTRDVSSKAGDGAIAGAYRAALADAISSSRSKADFIAGQVGSGVTRVHNVTEQSDSDDSYCDDDYSGGPTVTGAGGDGRSTAAAPRRRRKHRNGGRPGAPGKTGASARAARAPSCYVQADVTVDYEIS
jgi:hypothetical protein